MIIGVIELDDDLCFDDGCMFVRFGLFKCVDCFIVCLLNSLHNFATNRVAVDGDCELVGWNP